MRFDHIGIFVDDLKRGEAALSAYFPICRGSPIFEDPLIKVKVQFLYDTSGICYELVAPFGDGNPVDMVLRTRKNVLNHVAYRASDFAGAAARLARDGAHMLGMPCPAVAFAGRRVVFFFTPLGFIIELIEDDMPPPPPADAGMPGAGA